MWRMKLIFCLQTNTQVFCRLTVSLCVCVACHSQSTQFNKFAMSLQYLKENMKEKTDFLTIDKHQMLFKLIILLYVCVARHAQITQNNKFSISLKYIKKEVSDEVDFFACR